MLDWLVECWFGCRDDEFISGMSAELVGFWVS